MNNFLFYVVLTAISLHCTSIFGETITASKFNQIYSCTNPFQPTETSTIILDEDIKITDTTGCELIVPGAGFEPTDVVIFTSTTSNSMIIGNSAFWIVGLNLTFTGNAQFQILSGGILALQNNPTITMSGNSIFRPVQS